jgi:hypothetical protein
MKDLEASLYTDEIVTLLEKHGLKKTSFLIVDDVEQWCVDNGIILECYYRPFRIAKCLYSSEKGKHLILMSRIITSDMIESAIPVVSMRLGCEYANKLYSHNLFIKHTILHEIGHTKGLSEEESDTFAFNEINNTA